ncbi:MAG TPA: DUF2795 domain-containing protein [Gaiellaceae bacterium]|nr:DUF2795 domain-containing protein [Gaiellaceae bacterium]
MDNAAATELKRALVGVELPVDKARLLEYAVRQRVEPQHLDALRSLPEREYGSLDEVGEELVRVQPPRVEPDPARPHEESGAPPGGDDYTTVHPSDTGRVRDGDSVEDG